MAVARYIPKFRYDPEACAFKTWLLGVTRSKIANQFERRVRQPASADPDDLRATGMLERLAGESSWDSEWRKNLMGAALQRMKRCG